MSCRLRRAPRSRRYESWRCRSPCMPPRAALRRENSTAGATAMWGAMLPQCYEVFQSARGRRPRGQRPVVNATRGPLLIAGAHRRGLSGELERLARVDDARTLLRILHLQDGHVTVHVVAHVEVLAVGAPHHPLGQPAHLDLVEPGHLLAVDLEDDHAAVAVVVPGIPRLVAPAQEHNGGEIAP